MIKQEAKIIALRVNSKINACKEYDKAFHFYNKYEKTARTPDNDVVVYKKSGKVTNFTTYLLDYHSNNNG